MSILQAVALGIVQGLTEFLPISSAGHLTILKNLSGIRTENYVLFEVLLHCGTLVALCAAFSKDLRRMLAESIRMAADVAYNIRTFVHNHRAQDAKRYKKTIHNNYRKFVLLVLISAVPTAIIGYAARELVSLSQETLIVPGVCLILTALFLIVADVTEPGKKIPKDMSYTNGFMIGVAQGIAVLPGLSREGVTLSLSLMSGLDRRFAVKFSYIMSIPAILGALVLELGSLNTAPVPAGQIGIYLCGAVAAAVTGLLCVRRMLTLVRRKKLRVFAAYCLALGVFALAVYIAWR